MVDGWMHRCGVAEQDGARACFTVCGVRRTGGMSVVVGGCYWRVGCGLLASYAVFGYFSSSVPTAGCVQGGSIGVMNGWRDERLDG